MSSPTTSATSLPSDYSTPLAVVNSDDHSAWVIICNAFGIVVILICLFIRVYIRTKVSPPFGHDDHLLSTATFFAIIESSLVFAQVHEGFGKTIDSISASKLVKLQKFGYSAQLFYIVTIYVSKASIVMLFRRISPDKRHAMAAWIVLSACITFGVISIFLVALRCDLSHPWLQYGQSCGTLVAQWSAVTAFDIASEVMLFLMSVQLVWGLQTSFLRKSRVVFAFALRLPLIAIAAIRLNYISQQINSDDPTLTGAITGVVTQLEVFYAIMATTIPCLRPFLAGFVTNFGAMGGDTVMGGSHIGTSRDKKDTKASSKGSFALASLGSSAEGGGREGRSRSRRFREKAALRSKDRPTPQQASESFRPDQADHQTTVTHGGAGGGLQTDAAPDNSSMMSNDSQRMLYIRKEVQWQVESDGSRNASRLEGGDASHHV